jgi:hypothetical protein
MVTDTVAHGTRAWSAACTGRGLSKLADGPYPAPGQHVIGAEHAQATYSKTENVVSDTQS